MWWNKPRPASVSRPGTWLGEDSVVCFARPGPQLCRISHGSSLSPVLSYSWLMHGVRWSHLASLKVLTLPLPFPAVYIILSPGEPEACCQLLWASLCSNPTPQPTRTPCTLLGLIVWPLRTGGSCISTLSGPGQSQAGQHGLKNSQSRGGLHFHYKGWKMTRPGSGEWHGDNADTQQKFSRSTASAVLLFLNPLCCWMLRSCPLLSAASKNSLVIVANSSACF